MGRWESDDSKGFNATIFKEFSLRRSLDSAEEVNSHRIKVPGPPIYWTTGLNFLYCQYWERERGREEGKKKEKEHGNGLGNCVNTMCSYVVKKNFKTSGNGSFPVNPNKPTNRPNSIEMSLKILFRYLISNPVLWNSEDVIFHPHYSIL